MILLIALVSCSVFTISAFGEDNLAKFNQSAALDAYKDINDAAAADPVVVLGTTWKKFAYPEDYELPQKPVLGAYQDIIEAVKDPRTVLGIKTFETKCKYRISYREIYADWSDHVAVGYACRDASGQIKFCRLMEDDRTD